MDNTQKVVYVYTLPTSQKEKGEDKNRKRESNIDWLTTKWLLAKMYVFESAFEQKIGSRIQILNFFPI